MQRRFLGTSASAAAIRRKAIEISGAPPSVATIPDEGFDVGNASAFIRQVGCTRRVFLLKPYMTSEEMEGLAYRIGTLTKNDSLNSVLIATDDTDDAAGGALPSSLVARDYPFLRDETYDEGIPPAPGHTWHVAGGYDPLELYMSGKHKNAEYTEGLLTNLGALALATRGDARKTKIPVITIPHGIVHDGGWAMCMGSYVMATQESSFRIFNPSRGLSLDPVGLSYILPRLGQEFRQPAAKYAGCGIILGLMNYEADAFDMVETGLATNYMETPSNLGLLERTLAEVPPWNQQGLVKNPIRFYGDPDQSRDHNAEFRNVAVADTVHCFSSYRADGADMWTTDESDAYIGEDPSLDMDPMAWHEDRSSELVDLAATFNDIFVGEKTPQGIVERFREIALRETTDPEEQEVRDVAADFVERLTAQSPLSVCVVHRLLEMGSREGETIESCMLRERKVQTKMLGMSDFEKWAKHANKTNDSEDTDPVKWQHKSIADVTSDEIEELIES